MLVIRRRTGEAILIGADIEVEILEVSANRVKLGIAGPRSVQVTRKETVLTAESNLLAGLLTIEMKDLIVKKIAQIPQAATNLSDKSFESGYSGHPPEEENLGPA